MDEWNKIVENIENYDYISFDIFDTLLLRPFWEPTDLFIFVGIYVKELCAIKNELHFLKLRKKAEDKARFKRDKYHEDITLDQIYIELQKLLKCSKDDLEKIKYREIELEEYFCYRRRSGYDLYCKAVKANKKVICISDMYLSNSIIKKLLHKNGYMQFEKIYISSEMRLGKYTGNLYKFIKEDLGIIESSNLLHVGDNYYSDIIMAQRSGFDTLYLCKAKDMYIKSMSIKKIHSLKKRIENVYKANFQYDNPYKENEYSQNEEYDNLIFQPFSMFIDNFNYRIIDKKPSLIKKGVMRIFNKIK